VQQQDQLWYLLARQLTGDTSAEEIEALQKLTEADPDMKDLVNIIKCFCEIPTLEDSHKIKNAWSKLEQRLS
jgi:hypothetical protein